MKSFSCIVSAFALTSIPISVHARDSTDNIRRRAGDSYEDSKPTYINVSVEEVQQLKQGGTNEVYWTKERREQLYQEYPEIENESGCSCRTSSTHTLTDLLKHEACFNLDNNGCCQEKSSGCCGKSCDCVPYGKPNEKVILLNEYRAYTLLKNWGAPTYWWHPKDSWWTKQKLLYTILIVLVLLTLSCIGCCVKCCQMSRKRQQQYEDMDNRTSITQATGPAFVGDYYGATTGGNVGMANAGYYPGNQMGQMQPGQTQPTLGGYYPQNQQQQQFGVIGQPTPATNATTTTYMTSNQNNYVPTNTFTQTGPPTTVNYSNPHDNGAVVGTYASGQVGQEGVEGNEIRN